MQKRIRFTKGVKGKSGLPDKLWNISRQNVFYNQNYVLCCQYSHYIDSADSKTILVTRRI